MALKTQADSVSFYLVKNVIDNSYMFASHEGYYIMPKSNKYMLEFPDFSEASLPRSQFATGYKVWKKEQSIYEPQQNGKTEYYLVFTGCQEVT